MKRVLSLVLALVLVLGMVPVFANELTSDSLDLLKEFNVAQGDAATGDLRLDDTLTRAEMIVLLSRMFDVEETAKGFDGVYPFEDINDDQWWTPYIAYAFEQGWTTGTSATTFNPAGIATGKEVLIFAMRALGHKDFGKAEAGLTAEELKAEAAKVGLSVTSFGEVLRGEVFGLVYTTLFVVENVDGEILAEKFFGWKAPVVEPEVTELEVVKVTATNLKTMVVEFNKPVDEETITSTTVKAVKGTNTNVIDTDGRLLSEDGKTLTIVYASSAVPQSTEVKLTIDGVKSVDGSETIAAYTSSHVVNDVVVPEILDVVALNAKQIEVFFSEPMNIEDSIAFRVISNAKINNIAIIAKVQQNFTTNSVVFELNTALEAKEHAIEISGMTDYAAFKAPTKTLTFVVVEDKAAPVMTNAVARSISRIEVSFDETVAVQGNFWVNGSVATATPVPRSNNTRFILTGFTALDLGAVVQVRVEYQNQEDVVGNKVATKQLFTFQVQDDTTVPTVTVKVETGNDLTLTFSKPMLTNVGSIQILKANETAHSAVIPVNTLTFKNNTNDTVLELTASQLGLGNINAGTYYVNIKGMQDATVRRTLLPEQKIEISVLDSAAPTVVGGYTTARPNASATPAGSQDTITIFFSEAMNVDTLKNLSNYRLAGGNAFSQIDGTRFISAAADGKSVTLRLPNAHNTAGDPPSFTFMTNIEVFAVQDVAGNAIAPNTSVGRQMTAFGAGTTATFVAGDRVRLSFATPIATIDPSFITVEKQNEDLSWSAFAVPVSAAISGDNNELVTFTLNRSIGTTPVGYRVVISNKTAATDVFGRGYVDASVPPTFLGGTAALVDAIRPTLTSITQKVVDPAATPVVPVNNQFVIRMSENITFSTTTLKNDLIIKYADGTPVAANAYTLAAEGAHSILVTLLPNAKLTTGVNAISVQLFADRDLRDTASPANFAVPFAATTVNVTVDSLAYATSLVVAYENQVLTTIGNVVIDAPARRSAAQSVVDLLPAGAAKVALEGRITDKNTLVTAEQTKINNLQSAITAAEANLASVEISADGLDVASGTDWVIQDVADDYQDAINAAELIRGELTSLITAVETALTNLGTATTTFNNAKADGTM